MKYEDERVRLAEENRRILEYKNIEIHIKRVKEIVEEKREKQKKEEEIKSSEKQIMDKRYEEWKAKSKQMKIIRNDWIRR